MKRAGAVTRIIFAVEGAVALLVFAYGLIGVWQHFHPPGPESVIEQFDIRPMHPGDKPKMDI